MDSPTVRMITVLNRQHKYINDNGTVLTNNVDDMNCKFGEIITMMIWSWK